jgi:hypothetical protein
MPNTAMAVAKPAGGRVSARPDARSCAVTAPGRCSSTAAAHTVSSVKSPTLTIAKRSIRAYPPPSSTARVIARHTPTQTFTPIAGTSTCRTWPTPPYMPPTWSRVSDTVITQAHTSQLAPARGPGTPLKPSRPVLPVTIV